MATTEQIEHWFGYHPPTDQTLPVFETLDKGAEECRTAVKNAIQSPTATTKDRFAAIGAATKSFSLLLNGASPEGVDKAAAIRCLRMARMAANRAVLTLEPTEKQRYATMARDDIDRAWFNASGAVACGGK